MSNKYIYAYTNKLSYDLGEVVYIGKQDRHNKNLVRASEHLSGSDINQKTFNETDYILVARVPVGDSLSDIETYLIQKYSPTLNVVDNKNKNNFSFDEEKILKEQVENLHWYLIENSDESFNNLDYSFSHIDSMMKKYKSASKIFDSIDSFKNCSSFIADLSLSNGLVFIKPEIENSTERPIYQVTKTNIPKMYKLHNLVNDYWLTTYGDIDVALAK